MDVVVLESESDAKAMRLPGDETNVLAPTTVLWETAGPAHEVLAEVLAFSDEQVSDSGQNEAVDSGNGMSAGCWIPTTPGIARWLTPTA